MATQTKQASPFMWYHFPPVKCASVPSPVPP